MCLRELDTACGSLGSVPGTEWGLQNVKSQCHPPCAALDAFPLSHLTHPKDSEAVAKAMLFTSHSPRLVLLSWDYPGPGMSGTFWDLAGSEHCKERVPTSWRANPLSGCPRSHSENLIGDLKSNESEVLYSSPPRTRPTPGGWTHLAGRSFIPKSRRHLAHAQHGLPQRLRRRFPTLLALSSHFSQREELDLASASFLKLFSLCSSLYLPPSPCFIGIHCYLHTALLLKLAFVLEAVKWTG